MESLELRARLHSIESKIDYIIKLLNEPEPDITDEQDQSLEQKQKIKPRPDPND